MTVYLPIAEVSIDVFLLLGLGLGVGILSGMFGVGGGFLMTPLLIFIGIPPAVAVSTEANQITAASLSGAMAHWRARAVDMRLGGLLVAGGAVGSLIGVALFTALRESGRIDAFISISYVVLLGGIGGLMLWEALRAARARQAGGRVRRRRRMGVLAALPFKMRFPRSGLYESVIPPLTLGAMGGLLAALMGVGGGFFMVPAMIYLLRMPTRVVVGTSLFQIVFVTAITTVLQAVQNNTVDIVLAAILIVGGVVGAQIGARLAYRVPADRLRAGLAALVLGVCLKLAYDLVAAPADPYTLLPAVG